MADPKHLEILKQGVEAWNQWRQDDSEVEPDLSGLDLSGENFRKADLSEVNLRGANLMGASLSAADLRIADLRDALLGKANLSGANLMGADLRNANLNGAALIGAHFDRTQLSGADLTGSLVSHTVFGECDLREVKGLQNIEHFGPSIIGIETIYLSRGKIPQAFLRGTGIPDSFIEYMDSLIGTAFEYYSCFISYSSKDQEFVDRLYADLRSKGVRCWLATEDLKIGDKFRQRIEEAIRFHDKLLVVLSQTSVSSNWVEEEVEAAFARERKEDQLVLFPVRLDDDVMTTDKAWAVTLQRMRHIGDFRNWKDHNSYEKGFQRLLRDLQGDGGKEATESSTKPQRAKPKQSIDVVKAKVTTITHDNFGSYMEYPQGFQAVVVSFKNHLSTNPGQQTQSFASVTANLTYEGTDGSLHIDYGTWLREYTRFIDFDPGETHDLVIAKRYREDGRMVGLYNQKTTDPRKQRFRPNRTIYGPEERLLPNSPCNVTITLISEGITLFSDTYVLNWTHAGEMEFKRR